MHDFFNFAELKKLEKRRERESEKLRAQEHCVRYTIRTSHFSIATHVPTKPGVRGSWCCKAAGKRGQTRLGVVGVHRRPPPTSATAGFTGYRDSGLPPVGTPVYRGVLNIYFSYTFLFFSSLFLYFSFLFFAFLFLESRRKEKEKKKKRKRKGKEKTRKAGEKTKKRKAPLLLQKNQSCSRR